MDNDEIGKMILESIMNGNKKGNGKTETHAKQAEKLSKLYERYSEKEEFVKGDLIVAKEGCNLWRNGSKNLMVILEVLDNPKRGTDMQGEASETGSPYASLVYDIVAAYVDENGDFIEHMFDSRRFKKYKKTNVITLGL